jgi:hypothetical protein
MRAASGGRGRRRRIPRTPVILLIPTFAVLFRAAASPSVHENTSACSKGRTPVRFPAGPLQASTPAAWALAPLRG